ncbi:MAG: hypothetical protein A2064_01820 [Spirochaetes bacterium GWB1_66_5]|nr:MAG: hypothetical protein A2064_01820 [Spirochaetes bacterium GWB1_66_5]
MLALVLALVAVPSAADDWRARVEVSQGFRAGDALYFVADYLESRPGLTLWFILPFRTGPHVRVHQVVLCRASTGSARPEVLAVLEADRTTVLSRNHMFREHGDGVVVAYDRLWDRERRMVVKEIFSWTPADARLRRTPAAEAAEAFHRSFADYKSPYTANPGIVERSQVRELLRLLTLPVRAP